VGQRPQVVDNAKRLTSFTELDRHWRRRLTGDASRKINSALTRINFRMTEHRAISPQALSLLLI